MKRLIFLILSLCFMESVAFAGLECGMSRPNFIEKSEKYCPPEKPFFGTECGGCFGCDEKRVLPVQEFNPVFTHIRPVEEISVCQNRTLVKAKYGSFYESILTECPPDAPLRQDDGDCVACDSVSRIYVRSPADCEVCPNMTFYPYEKEAFSKPYEGGGYCRPNTCPETHPVRGKFACYTCDEEGGINTSPEECAKCPNRRMQNKSDFCILVNNNDKKKPLVQIPPSMVLDYACGDGPCNFPRSCDTKQDIKTTKENCDKCPNREYKDGRCILVSCAEGTVKTEVGCVACNAVKWPMLFRDGKPNCDQCPNRVWNDKYSECQLIDCPVGYFKVSGSCYPCDQKNKGSRYRFQTTAEECAKCPERTYQDGECFIKGK